MTITFDSSEMEIVIFIIETNFFNDIFGATYLGHSPQSYYNGLLGQCIKGETIATYLAFYLRLTCASTGCT